MAFNKNRLLKFYYLVGFYLLIAGNASGQGLSHVADIFRILNHVEIPAIDNFFPLIPPFIGSDNNHRQHGSTPSNMPDVQDVRLYVIDEDNPTLKREISRQNYANRMTGTLSKNIPAQELDAITNGVQRQPGVRDGRLQVEEILKNGDENEVDGAAEVNASNKRLNKLKIIVHGWGESASKSWYAQMTAAYMLLEAEKKQILAEGEIAEDLKVLQVDWSVQAAAEYSIAARNTRRVGHYVGQFIADLHKDLDYSLDDIHIIGHSLGGHVAGFIGKEVFRITGQRIGRITALDPAGPLFEGSLISKEDRLSDSDAKMVDVVHTDGGYFGCKVPMGSIDFFPNGGVRIQPGCDDISTKRLTMDDIVEFAFCSHTRSYKYFIESIGDKAAMTATKCDSWTNYEMGLCSDDVSIAFGEDIPIKAERGSYFFKTNSQPPFAFTL